MDLQIQKEKINIKKKIGEKNKNDINAIYGGARKVFKIIGLIILGIIFLISAFLSSNISCLTNLELLG